jgi:Cof subfamily protein (haloacid dehalogenase superfamily)
VFTTSTREMALQEIIFRTMSFNPSLTEEEAREVAENLGFFTCLQFIDDLDKFFEEGVEVRKFVAFHSDIELIDKMKKVLGEIEGLAISSSFRDNIEITDINAQKGIILEKVATKMDIAREDVMILGDSFNDYSMFEIFEETVAMKNAIPEVKAIAKYITDSNDNLGVAKAIYNVINNEMDKMLKEK